MWVLGDARLITSIYNIIVIDDIDVEKIPQDVEKFDHDQLKHVQTEVKQHLPDSQDLAREKTIEQAAAFPIEKLKHVEPNVSTNVEVIADK